MHAFSILKIAFFFFLHQHRAVFMESKKTEPQAKKLGQVLQEKQEPFILEIYLLERGYVKKRLNSESGIVKPSTTRCRIEKGKKGAPPFTRIVRTIHRKLVKTADDDRRQKTEVSEKNDHRLFSFGESERYSSASSRTVFDSCSDTEKEEASTSERNDHSEEAAETSQSLGPCIILKQKEAVADYKLNQRCMKQKEQVLRKIPEDHNPQRHCFSETKKITEDTILSATLWELILNSQTENKSGGSSRNLGMQDFLRFTNNSAPQLLLCKRVLQDTKQLLFDCVKEVVEDHCKRETVLRFEEMGKLICDRINLWGKEAGKVKNRINLLDLNNLSSAKEWTAFEPEKWDIATEVSEAILREITCDIVTEITHLRTSLGYTTLIC